MTLRKGHGAGAGQPRVEVMPVDELPKGVPSGAVPQSRADFDNRGKFARGNQTSRKGGRARAGKTRLADRLGLRSLPAGSDFATYKASAVSFRRAQCAALAASVGGGYCGPAPSSFVASAALQLAWSRYFSDLAAETGDGNHAVLASKLANDSRQNLLAAHELAAKEALARSAAQPTSAHTAAIEAFSRKPTPPAAALSTTPTTFLSSEGQSSASGRTGGGTQ